MEGKHGASTCREDLGQKLKRNVFQLGYLDSDKDLNFTRFLGFRVLEMNFIKDLVWF